MSRKDRYGAFDHTTGEGQKRMYYTAVVGFDPGPARHIDLIRPGDYGCDPLGDGMFRMVPSGDIVDATERNRRLAK